MNIVPMGNSPRNGRGYSEAEIDEWVNDIINSFPEIQFKAMEIELFRDLCGNYNLTTWDPQDIINFFKTPGNIISDCIPDIKISMLETNADISARFISAKTKGIKKIIMCVYGKNGYGLYTKQYFIYIN